MPYITSDRRIQLATGLTPNEPGDLNFLFSKLIDKYITFHGKSYKAINDVVGALECCKLEVYRRIAAPYEDIKVQQNSDVFSTRNTGSGTC